MDNSRFANKSEFGEEIVRDRKPLSKKAVMREVGELAVFYGSAKEEGAQGMGHRNGGTEATPELADRHPFWRLETAAGIGMRHSS